MEKMNEKCESCPVYKEEMEKIVKNSDSVFDAAMDLGHFIEKCQLNCKIITEKCEN